MPPINSPTVKEERVLEASKLVPRVKVLTALSIADVIEGCRGGNTDEELSAHAQKMRAMAEGLFDGLIENGVDGPTLTVIAALMLRMAADGCFYQAMEDKEKNTMHGIMWELYSEYETLVRAL